MVQLSYVSVLTQQHNFEAGLHTICSSYLYTWKWPNSTVSWTRMNHTSLKVGCHTHCTGANIRPHQLCLSEQKKETAISCRKCILVAVHIHDRQNYLEGLVSLCAAALFIFKKCWYEHIHLQSWKGSWSYWCKICVLAHADYYASSFFPKSQVEVKQWEM